jgi:hypothetical protein
MGSMRKVIAAAATVSIAVLGIAPSASAFEGGGRKPSEAPLITAGVHYTGQLNNHKADANFGGYEEVAIWRLPPLTTHDVITVNWHGTPFTHDSGFPICMNFAQGIDDYNWGSTYDLINSYGCYPEGPVYGLSGSGTAQTTITVQETNANSSYLEFASDANAENPANFETFPYDFSVSPPLHYLGVAIRQVKRVSASGILYATANLANGLPAPDGLPFGLAVTWPGGGTASATGISAGGTIGFQLALPETAFGKEVTFVASHPADGTYQAVSSPKLQVKVAKPKALPPSPCLLAERHALSLKRQYKRLANHARRAHGAARRTLRRRANRVKRKLHTARLQAQSACGTA